MQIKKTVSIAYNEALRTTKHFIRKHFLAVFLAVCVGIIYVFPHLYFPLDLGPTYKGIYMSGSYDEDYYNAIVRQVYDGVSVTDNPHIEAHFEESISTLYNFQEYAIGILGKIFGLSITSLALFSKFIFPALLFLVLYFLTYVFTKSRASSLLIGTLVLLGEELAPLNIHSLVQTFLFNSPFHNFLFFNRPINPQVSAIFFFLVIFCLVKLWQNRNSKKWAIISGISIGILPYVYFYFWTFCTILIGVMFLFACISKNKNFIQNTSLTIFTSLLLSLPFIYKAVSLLGSGGASIQKNYVLTHRFIFEKVVLVPLVFFLVVYVWNYFVSKKAKNLQLFSFLYSSNFCFILLLLLTACIASNQQVIHGYEIQQHHYHFMTNIPVFIISVGLIFSAFLERYIPKWRTFLIGLIIMIISLCAISVQTSSYLYWKPIFVEYQKYESTFDWLENNTKVGETVFANNALSELLPVYTHNNVYGSLHTSVYPISLHRLKHNYFMTMYLRGVREKDVREYVYDEENRNELGQYIFEGQYWRAVCGSFGCFPDTTLDELILEYKNFLRTDFEHNVKKYPVAYILWDKDKDPAWKLQEYSFLRPVVFEKKEVILFEVH